MLLFTVKHLKVSDANMNIPAATPIKSIISQSPVRIKISFVFRANFCFIVTQFLRDFNSFAKFAEALRFVGAMRLAVVRQRGARKCLVLNVGKRRGRGSRKRLNCRIDENFS